MVKQSRPWFRMYGELLQDRKIARVARLTGQERMAVIGAWAGILCLASDSPARGMLLLAPGVPYTVEDLAEEIGTERETMAALVKVFIELDMLCAEEDLLIVSHWADRQFESDSSTERSRRHRAQQQECNGDATLQDRCGNAPEAEAEADTDTEAEAEQKAAAPAANAEELTARIFSIWEDLTGKRLTPTIRDTFCQDIAEYGLEKVAYAVQQAQEYDKPMLAYVHAILESNHHGRDSPSPPSGEVIEYLDEFTGETVRSANNGRQNGGTAPP